MENNQYEKLIEFLEDKFEVIDDKFQGVEKRFDTIEGQISQLPTKSYVDDKFAELEGTLITKLRKEDQKVNRLLEMMKQKKLLSESEVAELSSLEVFPKQA